MIVRLDKSEVMQAATGAVQRIVQNIMQGRKPAHGVSADAHDLNVLGCIGELSVAKGSGVYWSGNLGQMRAKDAGLVQVRATMRLDGSLIVHPEDPDDDPFFLVVVGVGPHDINGWLRCDIKGWLRARHCKVRDYWREDVRSPAFFVPAGVLKAIPDDWPDDAPILRSAPAERAQLAGVNAHA